MALLGRFVLAMLLQLDLVKWSQMRPFMHKFRQLDNDKSGRLGREDLQTILDDAKSKEPPKPKSPAFIPKPRFGCGNAPAAMPPPMQPQPHHNAYHLDQMSHYHHGAHHGGLSFAGGYHHTRAAYG